MGIADLLGSFLGDSNGMKGTAKTGSIDASTIISLVGTLASGSQAKTGANEGKVNPAVLLSEVGKLAGKTTTKKATTVQNNTESQNGNMMMTMVKTLASGNEAETGAQQGSINPAQLMDLLSVFTSAKKDGKGFDINALVKVVVPILLNNKDLLSGFKTNPIGTLEKITGIDLPDEKMAPAIAAIQKKLKINQK